MSKPHNTSSGFTITLRLRRLFDGIFLAVTLLIGLGGSWYLYQAIQTSESAQQQEQLRAMGQSVVDQLDLNLARTIGAIRGAGLMLEAQHLVQRDEFNPYARNVMAQVPDLAFIEWQPVVPSAALSTFEREAQAQGLAGYRVVERIGQKWVGVAARPDYVPVLFAWPEQARRLGVDTATDALVMQSKTRARDSGAVVASEAFQVDGVAANPGNPGNSANPGSAFMLSAAVFKGSENGSVQQRRQNLTGYVSGMVRLSGLLQNAAFNANAAQLDLLIMDPSASANKLLYVARGETSDLPQPLSAANGTYTLNDADLLLTVEVGTRPWELVLHPRPAFFVRQTNQHGVMALSAGGIATCLLATMLAWTQRGRRLIEAAQLTTLAAEQALALERQRLNNIILGTHAGTWEWQIQTDALTLNQRSAEILGYDINELNAWNVLNQVNPPPPTCLSMAHWESLIHPLDIAQLRDLLRRHFSGDLPFFDSEHRMRHKLGHWIWVSSRGCVSSRTGEGRPESMSGTTMDISARKSVDDMKSEFVSTVSHELRTPLTSIRGALGLVAAGTLGELPAPAMKVLAIANKNVLRLVYLVNDLLDMEKIIAGKMELFLKPEALMPLVESAIEAVAAYAEQYSVHFVLSQRADDVTVQVDAGRLQQVLSNLLSNAAKFSPPGGQVSIRVRVIDQVVRVEVIDQGCGILPEFHGRIFQKFSQADSSDTRHKGGTGLGLAISKELMERMDGTIGFSSEAGKGSVFHFELPF